MWSVKLYITNNFTKPLNKQLNTENNLDLYIYISIKYDQNINYKLTSISSILQLFHSNDLQTYPVCIQVYTTFLN